jgi:hypothetical protein
MAYCIGLAVELSKFVNKKVGKSAAEQFLGSVKLGILSA